MKRMSIVVCVIILLTGVAIGSAMEEEKFVSSGSTENARNIWFVKAGESLKGVVEEADNNDIIIVYPGVYHEGEIIIKKPLTIIGVGQDKPVIDVGDKERGVGIYIRNSNVTIDRLRIVNCHTGIKIDPSSPIKYITIRSCSITATNYAVKVEGKEYTKPPFIDFLVIHGCDLTGDIYAKNGDITQLTECRIEGDVSMEGTPMTAVVNNEIGGNLKVNTGDAKHPTGIYFIHFNTFEPTGKIEIDTSYLLGTFMESNEKLDTITINVNQQTYWPPFIYIPREDYPRLPDISWKNWYIFPFIAWGIPIYVKYPTLRLWEKLK